jgi:flagellin
MSNMSVRTNVASIAAAGQLGRTNKGLANSLSKISSGLRVGSASEDAAGLGVSTNLTTQVISTRQAMRNTNDGISIIQTAEAASNEVTDVLQRMRELAVQSASDTLADSERSFISDEFGQLRSEVGRIAAVTEFNGLQLVDGTNSTISVQVGIQNASSSSIDISLVDLTTSGLSIDALDLSSATGARNALDSIDTALSSVNSLRSGFGASQNRLDSALNNSQVSVEALSAASSRIMDTDFAAETSNLTKMQIMQQAGVASLAQAKSINQGVIALLG